MIMMKGNRNRSSEVFIIIFLIFIESISLQAQSLLESKEHLFTQPLSYTAYQTDDSIKIDGIAHEHSWQTASWSSYFTDIEGNIKPRPTFQTRFKMLWDNSYLYLYAEMEEPHLWGTLTNHDDIVYNNNDFEVFIDPDGDTHQYYEIEVNILKTIFDLYMNKPYRNGGKPYIRWDAANLKTGVSMNGTLNKPDDTDKSWSLEMAIPFSALSKEKKTPIPQNNTVWRMNFSRVQWDLEIKDDQYERKKDSNNKLLPEHNWVWSEQGVINMHFPERWGYIIFSSQTNPDDQKKFTMPFAESVKQYLWLIYYRQKDYFAEHQHFATNLEALGFWSDKIKIENQSCSITLNASEKDFASTLFCEKKNEHWQLNQEGLITKVK